MSTNPGRKEIRIMVEEHIHAAVRILAESVNGSMDSWVSNLIRDEVARQFATARRLTATITERDLIRVEGASEKRQRVYFIQRGENGPIKIGMAVDVENRRAKLQTACAEELKVLLVIEQTDEYSERKIHRQFRKIRQEGEWFSCHPELLEFISSLQPASPIAVGERKGDGK